MCLALLVAIYNESVIGMEFSLQNYRPCSNIWKKDSPSRPGELFGIVFFYLNNSALDYWAMEPSWRNILYEHLSSSLFWCRIIKKSKLHWFVLFRFISNILDFEKLSTEKLSLWTKTAFSTNLILGCNISGSKVIPIQCRRWWNLFLAFL